MTHEPFRLRARPLQQPAHLAGGQIPTSDPDHKNKTSRPIRRQPVTSGRLRLTFRGKAHERERFQPGWMLTLVRQLVELEKRRRDYCSDPPEPTDCRRPLRPLWRPGLPARRPHQRWRTSFLRAPRAQVRARTEEDRCGNTGRDRTTQRRPHSVGRRLITYISHTSQTTSSDRRTGR
jgi:hypothetical protein